MGDDTGRRGLLRDHAPVRMCGRLVAVLAVVLGVTGSSPPAAHTRSAPAAAGPVASGVIVPADDDPGPSRSGPGPAAPATPAAPSPAGFTPLVPGRDGVTPVAWDRCRPVSYVVRTTGAVPGGPALLAEAFDELSRASGLTFRNEGRTGEAPRADRPPLRAGGAGWAPVLVAWSDPAETPGLAGDVAGLAAADPRATPGVGLHLVTGQVVLDAPQLRGLLARPGGRDQVRAVVLHELGHLAGLGHVDDPGQLMAPRAGGPTSYAAGDLRGLAALAARPCG